MQFGSQAGMVGAIRRPGGYVEKMVLAGVDVKMDDNVELIKMPKYDGVFSYEHIER